MQVLSNKTTKLLLNAKDWKILNIMLENSRLPLSKIAKLCLMSRQSVEYRLKQMQINNLVMGFKTVINIGKLGYKSYHIFLALNTLKKEKEFLDKAKKLNYVNAIITYRGKFNYEISIMAKTLEEFLEIYQNLIKEFSIYKDETLILLKTIKSEVLPSHFFKKDIEMIKNFKKFKKKEIEYKVDIVDLEIMKILSNDSSLSNIEISNRLNTSKDKIKYRIKKLIDSNHIIQFRPVINYFLLNLSINTILLKLDYYEITTEDFEKFIKMENSVIWCAKTFGKYDYIIYVLSENLNDFHDSFENLKDKFENVIKTYELLFAHKEYKYSFMADSIKLEK